MLGLSLTVDTYKITDPPNKLDKNLPADSKITLQNVDPIEPCDILSPTLICVYSENLCKQNYAYISGFGNRYYYIENVSVLGGQRCVIKLSVDPLKTYATDIKKCKGVCLRTEKAPTYIPDNKFPMITNKRYIELDNYPSTPFTRSPSYPYVLTTIGSDT